MRAVHRGPLVGLAAQVALLAALWATVGLHGPGWVVGLVCCAVMTAALSRSLDHHHLDRLGPADRVTLTRATLACGVAALAADAFGRAAPATAPTVLIAMTVVALVLDGVDGPIARRTATARPFGARFDLEVDAFLILVLSGYVARSAGAWVLTIGLARYVFVVAGWLFPWLRAMSPPRYWAKVVAATQAVVLTIAAADVLPRSVTDVALVGALALLAESFGHQAWWLWCHRGSEPLRPAARPDRGTERGPDRGPEGRRGWRGVAALAVTCLAVVLIWWGLTAPDQLAHLTPMAFVRIPAEAVVFLVVVLVLPRRVGRVVAVLAGVVLGVLTIVRALDLGFFAALDRPFNPVVDWAYLGSALGVLQDSVGRWVAVGLLLVGALVALAVLVLMPLSLLRVARTVAGHRAVSFLVTATLGTLWLVFAALGVQVDHGAPVASTSVSAYAYGQVSRIPSGIRDQQQFARAAADDSLRSTPADQLLTGLRGKDVLFVFVESYGRVAVQGSALSVGVNSVLDSGTRRLRAAGYSAESGFLTSPTFGGISWLAHSTLQSGLWVDSRQKYDVLLASQRGTLSDAFKRAGWRTVADIPANTHDWPQGAFYGYDTIYDSRNVGYVGPQFGYATMPDQYTLAALQRRELGGTDRKPVMAEIDLVSSHVPWTPTPRLVDPSRLGDGSVFDGMPQQAPSRYVVWSSPQRVQAAYGQSVEYSLSALISFVQSSRNDQLVVVFLGDHQPATIVSGVDSDHDVPITIVANDPAVLDRISGWGWQDGLRPGPDAPVWRMDAFRDRFLAAFGPRPGGSQR